jgi:hypothetical protein
MAAINSLRALKGVTAPEELKKGMDSLSLRCFCWRKKGLTPVALSARTTTSARTSRLVFECWQMLQAWRLCSANHRQGYRRKGVCP